MSTPNRRSLPGARRWLAEHGVPGISLHLAPIDRWQSWTDLESHGAAAGLVPVSRRGIFFRPGGRIGSQMGRAYRLEHVRRAELALSRTPVGLGEGRVDLGAPVDEVDHAVTVDGAARPRPHQADHGAEPVGPLQGQHRIALAGVERSEVGRRNELGDRTDPLGRLALEWADWLGAVIGVARAGEGCAVDGSVMVDFVNRCPEVTTTIPKADRGRIEWAFDTVIEPWTEWGLLDDDGRMTSLGLSVLPAALRRAWGRSPLTP